VYTLALDLQSKALICSIDKDLKQIPGLHYNYNKEEYSEVSEEEAVYNLALQTLIGDNGDNIKVNHGLGPKKASIIIRPSMTKYKNIKYIYLTYIKFNGIDEAKSKLKQIYNLVRLRNMNNY
jgi:hypothetical protein